MTDQMRENFEQFVIRRDGSIWVSVIGEKRSYNEPIERDFAVWISSRQMLVVDLPAVEAWDNDGRLDREKDDTADCSMGLVPVIDVRIALRAAGITAAEESRL